MTAMASLVTGVSIVYSTVCSGGDQRKHQSSASLAFVKGIHRSSLNFPHKGPVTRKMFPFDDVIMIKTTAVELNKIHVTHTSCNAYGATNIICDMLLEKPQCCCLAVWSRAWKIQIAELWADISDKNSVNNEYIWWTMNLIYKTVMEVLSRIFWACCGFN